MVGRTVGAVQLDTVSTGLVKLFCRIAEAFDEVMDLGDRQRARTSECHSHQRCNLWTPPPSRHERQNIDRHMSADRHAVHINKNRILPVGHPKLRPDLAG
jgi:hypothetical protein